MLAEERTLIPLADRILVTGATGFLGGAVLRQLLAEPRSEVRILVRTPDAVDRAQPVSVVVGDLTRPRSLDVACTGVDTVVHAASYVGPDATACAEVNTEGTRALVGAARAAGVRRILSISTASVHGRGPHRAVEPASTPTRPRSPVSASRLAGERHVREAGGVVVRPHLVYGEGDRWFVPALARLIRAAGTDIGDPRARHSLVRVDALARAVAGLVDVPDPAWPHGAVLAVNHPEPTTTAAMITTVARLLRLPTGRAAEPGAGHDHAMLATDHWFASTAVWALTGADPGPAFPDAFPACLAWYRSHLAL